MKWENPVVLGFANIAALNYLRKRPVVEVRHMTICPNCKQRPISCTVGNFYHRCEPCANKLMTAWSDSRQPGVD